MRHGDAETRGRGDSALLCRIVEKPIDPQEAIAAVAGPDAGAIVTFMGTVRDRSQDKKVLRLEYEAYAEMGEKVIGRIAAELSAEFPGSRIAVLHRMGALGPGEVAVVVAAAAPHRDEAFAAARAAIDRIKEEVPIWKKEVFEDGSSWAGTEDS